MLFEGNERRGTRDRYEDAGRLPPGQSLTFEVAGSSLRVGSEI